MRRTLDALYFFLLLITVIGLMLVGCLIFTFLDPLPQGDASGRDQIEGSTLLEATWTIIPLAHLPDRVRVGRAAVLPHLQPADQRDEHLHRRQAVDVEGGASGRPARDQCAARADGPAMSS